MPSTFSQIFPPAPTFTEKDVGNLEGRVFIITGASGGIGFALAKLLYGRGADIYIAARSSEKINHAITNIEASPASSKGQLHPLILDLADLRTIKKSAEDFLARADRLDVLVHNAGVMTPPAGSKSNLGHDLEMATNCLGPFLFNYFLEPILKRTAHAASHPDSVRIIWLSSFITAAPTVPPGGVQFDEEHGGPKVMKNAMQNYMQSKVGNVFLASEVANRLGIEGIISISVNPGMLETDLQRHTSKIQGLILSMVLKPAIYGAYSELFAALSPDVTAKHNGGFLVPWGRFGDIPDHIDKGRRPKAEGGSGAAEQFWAWCLGETKPFCLCGRQDKICRRNKSSFAPAAAKRRSSDLVEMSSTTEESDWNMSAPSRLSNSVSHVTTARDSPYYPPPPEPRSPQSHAQRASSFASTAAQLESQLTQTVTTNEASVAVQPTSSTLPTPATVDGVPHSASNQKTAEWEAARESVLSQMVTSQDLAGTTAPTTKVTRGGVKTGGRRGRGGRRPKVKIEGEDSVSLEIAEAAGVKTETPTRGKNRGGRPRGSRSGGQVNRGGRPRGSKSTSRGGRGRGSRGGLTAAEMKRKRKRGEDDDEDAPDDTDVSEEFNLLEHTSSGRRITQAKTFTPINLDPPTTSTKKISPKATRAITPPSAKRPKFKRRKPGEAAVCINCGRGHSPTSNQIVFCDACNTPWHQFCHDRPITPSVIQIEEKEWLCSECTTARNEKAHITGKVPAQASMTLAEKRTYFQNLDKSELVSLLLHASNLHPDLPIFLPPPPVSIPTIIEPRPLPVPIQSTLDEDEYIEIYVEQEPLPYPKAGNGLVLPPEDDDLGLLIDEDVASYSHSWRGTHGWEGPGGMSWAAGAGGPAIGHSPGGVAVSVAA